MNLIINERNEGIGTLTLNRPLKRNALSRELVEQLSQTISDLENDQALRVLILTGAGDAFCAGTDISELTNLTEAEALQTSLRGQKICDQIESFPVPVIAAV